MRKFLFKIAVFLLFVYLLAFPIEWFFNSTLKRSKEFMQGEVAVWEDILNGSVDAEMLIYGSSRAWVQIDPQVLYATIGMKAYNFGIDGHNFWLQYLRHQLYLKHNPKPRYIIQTVDLFTLQKREDLYHYAQFLPYLANDSIEKYTSSYEGFSFWDYHLPLVKYAGEFSVIYNTAKSIVATNKPYRVRGFKGVDRKWNADFDKAGQKEEYVVKLDSSSIKLFEKFVVQCKQLGIQLFFVYPPEYYNSNLLVKGKKEVINIFDSIAKSNNIPFLDYTKDTLSYDSLLFYNTQHLNYHGAEIFSKKLAHDINKEIQSMYESN